MHRWFYGMAMKQRHSKQVGDMLEVESTAWSSSLYWSEGWRT